MNRQQKLKALEDKKAAGKIPVAVDSKPFLLAFEERVKQLSKTLQDGVDINGLDSLLNELKAIGGLKEYVEGLEKTIKGLQIPEIPPEIKIKDLSTLLDALENLSEKKIDLSPLQLITDQVGNLIDKIDELTPPKQGQKPEDYLPMRRVVLVGKRLLFDDSFYTGGGGGSNIPTKNGAVPVVNPDGSNIGGGSITNDGTFLSQVQLETELDEKFGDVGQKGQVASAPVTISTDTLRIDAASSTVTYIGTAAAGSATSAAVWQVKKIDSSSGTSILFADGNINYDNVWDNRASLSYS